jgi:Na+-translocating ferredoxin:NAD+ oxidoreductase RnfD subunit
LYLRTWNALKFIFAAKGIFGANASSSFPPKILSLVVLSLSFVVVALFVLERKEMRLVLLLALEEEVVVSKHRAHNTESKEFRR